VHPLSAVSIKIRFPDSLGFKTEEGVSMVKIMMTRKILVFGVLLVLVALTYAAGQLVATGAAARKEEQLLAVSWGDGRYGPAFYGAYVSAMPEDGGYSVKAHVKIGRGNSMIHDCGELGRVRTPEEASARWGKIEWREDGLHIGRDPDQYFLARKDVENHR
jgi:hypothetical protein